MTGRHLFCATSNRGKLREFALAAERLGRGEWQFTPVTGIEPCDETGSTFAENAGQKAVYYSRHADGLLFAEDSGLSVDALDGAPGVYSARFAGEGATDEQNNRLLIQQLAGVPTEQRSARYVCAIALARNGEVLATFEGTVEGRIVDEPQGSNGFGYDPYFFYPPFECTFAQATPEQKLSVSHRGKAVEAMLRYVSGQDLS